MRTFGSVIVALCVVSCGDAPQPQGDSDAAVVIGPAHRFATRRMTRSEYDRTVRDLLGTAQRPGGQLPADDATDGFDVVAAGLVISPLHVELYDQAAGALAAEIVDEPLAAAIDASVEVEAGGATSDAEWQGIVGPAFMLGSSGTLDVPLTVPKSGVYRVSARVFADQAGPDVASTTLAVAGGPLPEVFDVPGTDVASGTWVSVEVPLARGVAHALVGYDQDYYDAETGQDRNLFVDSVRLEGPLDFTYTPNPAWERVMTCDPAAAADQVAALACVRGILEAFAPRAWRRPVDPVELEPLLDIADEVLAAGDPPRWAAEFALRAVLASPWFVLHVEPSPDAAPLDDWALAARLSYLLWSSLPDDELRARAEDGTLSQPDVLRAQIRRLLDDPRADALADDLAGQWLMIRGLGDIAPDAQAYPTFTDEVRDAMREQMRLHFLALAREPRPITDLLLGTETFVNPLIADEYLMRPQPDDRYLRVDVGWLGRPGWLGLPGLLAATSYPTRTSPVRRGVWVLSSLLCDETPPPPADVPSFPDPDPSAATVRERLEAHRNQPACATCHDRIDPLGLALEHYNGIGRYRDEDADEPIDATGQLPDGTAVDGLGSLATAIASDARFPACVMRKVYTYAHRRAPADDEATRIEALTERWTAGGQTFAGLIEAIVLDDGFLTTGDPAAVESTEEAAP